MALTFIRGHATNTNASASTSRRTWWSDNGKSTAKTRSSTSTQSATTTVSTFTAKLFSCAAKANARSLTASITLAHVLAGDTCPPISLADFEAFLTFCDFSVENLQFIVWFLDYRKRFTDLPEEFRHHCLPPRRAVRSWLTDSSILSSGSCTIASDRAKGKECSIDNRYEQSLSRLTGSISQKSRPISTVSCEPGPSCSPPLCPAFVGPASPAPVYTEVEEVRDPPQWDIPGFYEYAARISNSDEKIRDRYSCPVFPTPSASSNPSSKSCTFLTPPPTSFSLPKLASSRAGIPPIHIPRVCHSEKDMPSNSNGRFSMPSIMPENQPLRTECSNVTATFLVPGAPKELLLPANLRDTAIQELSRTTHPDALLPIYESIYELVETVSLPRFFVQASTITNRPKQLFWYFLGLIDVLIGLGLVFLLVMSPSRMLSVPSQSHRAWRLLAIPFAWLGVMQIYAGYRGFCQQIFHRGSVQLRVWELVTLEDDAEAQAYVAALSQGTLPKAKEPDNSAPETPMSPIEQIAPFLLEPKEKDSRAFVNISKYPPLPSISRRDTTLSAFSVNKTDGQAGTIDKSLRRKIFKRPPIFGPEKIVEDERISAVHKQIWHDLLLFGAAWAVVFSVVVLSVPTWHVNV